MTELTAARDVRVTKMAAKLRHHLDRTIEVTNDLEFGQRLELLLRWVAAQLVETGHYDAALDADEMTFLLPRELGLNLGREIH